MKSGAKVTEKQAPTGHEKSVFGDVENNFQATLDIVKSDLIKTQVNAVLVEALAEVSPDYVLETLESFGVDDDDAQRLLVVAMEIPNIFRQTDLKPTIQEHEQLIVRLNARNIGQGLKKVSLLGSSLHNFGSGPTGDKAGSWNVSSAASAASTFVEIATSDTGNSMVLSDDVLINGVNEVVAELNSLTSDIEYSEDFQQALEKAQCIAGKIRALQVIGIVGLLNNLDEAIKIKDTPNKTERLTAVAALTIDVGIFGTGQDASVLTAGEITNAIGPGKIVTSRKARSIMKSTGRHAKFLGDLNTVTKSIGALNSMLNNNQEAYYRYTSMANALDTIESGLESSLDLGQVSSESELLEALALENSLRERVTVMFEELRQVGLGTTHEHEDRVLKIIGNRPIHDMLIKAGSEAELAQLNETISNIIEQINGIDAPYKANSKRIRSIENGTAIRRDLSDALSSKLPELRLGFEAIENIMWIVHSVMEEVDSGNVAACKLAVEEKLEEEKLITNLSFLGAADAVTPALNDAVNLLEELDDIGKLDLIDNSGVRASEFLKEFRKARFELEKDETLSNIDVVEEAMPAIEFKRDPTKVFPPGTRVIDILDETKRAYQNKLSRVDWQRIVELDEIRNQLPPELEGTIYLTAKAPWSAEPFFVLHIKPEGYIEEDCGVAIFEVPLHGRATYVASIDGDLIKDWREVAAMERMEARDVGVEYIIHTPSSTSSEHSRKIQKASSLR